MKKFFCFILLFVCINCLAQDEVVFHNGNIAKGKVTEVTDLYIKFSYDGEDLVNTIGRCAISEVRFQSGRVQQMSQKVDVKSPDDWENVRLVYDKNEVLGLKSLGQIEKHSSGTWSFSITAGHFSEKTMLVSRAILVDSSKMVMRLCQAKSTHINNTWETNGHKVTGTA